MPLSTGLSKLNSKRHSPSVDVDLGGTGTRTAEAIDEPANASGVIAPEIPRKEVIQPQLPLRLPCYDFTPIIDPTFDGCLPKGVSPPASGIADFRGVTGGVYKARERIHRGNADPRLLATPPS
jgi:hypothetical protein